MKKLLKIDIDDLQKHRHLESTDVCYYLMEHVSHGGYTKNQLMSNFKKDANRPPAELVYKYDAIKTIGLMLKEAVRPAKKLLIVPIPPSKSKQDPLYDDRLMQVLNLAFSDNDKIKIIELVEQLQTTDAVHKNSNPRPYPNQLKSRYVIKNEDKLDEASLSGFKNIVVFDDVITTGAHYKAIEQIIKEKFPRMSVTGVFIAKTVWPDNPTLNCFDTLEE